MDAIAPGSPEHYIDRGCIYSHGETVQGFATGAPAMSAVSVNAGVKLTPLAEVKLTPV